MDSLVDPLVTSVTDARVVLLNGPPGAGKDTAGRAIVRAFNDARCLKFAAPIKRATHADFNLPLSLPDDAFELVKDQPRPEFFGLLPRAAYIHKSEKDMKLRFGPDIYGRLALRSLWPAYQEGVRLFAFTDSGFADEARAVMGFVGQENCLLIRIHADARGKSFKGDSRTFIDLEGVATVDLVNNGASSTPFEAEVVTVLRQWLWCGPGIADPFA